MAGEEKIRKRRKKMYQIIAPDFLNQRVIGETPLEEAILLKGKSVTTNLFNLMGDMKKQYVELTFFVNEVKENKGFTILKQYKLSNSFMKRLVRRGRTKVDDSFHLKDTKGEMVQLKPVIITLGRTSNSVATSLLKKLRVLMLEELQKTSFEQFVRDLLDYKPQRAFKSALTKIYPVKQVEVRLIKLDKTAKKETVHDKITPDKHHKTEEDGDEEHEEKIAEKIRKTQDKQEKSEDKPSEKKTGAPKEDKKETPSETPKELAKEEKKEAPVEKEPLKAEIKEKPTDSK